MKILITGACGFIGRHLVDHIKENAEGTKLYAVDCINNCDYYPQNFFQLDLTQEEQVTSIIDLIRPDCIIHLAGLLGNDEPLMIYHANVTALLFILEAVRRMSPHTIVLTAGSAAEYGEVTTNQLPISENTPCRPVNMYGQTKYLASQLIDFYYRAYRLNGMVFRPFQLIGKGISSKLAPGAFAEQIRNAVNRNDSIIKVGNLKSFRDLLDIADAVKAIWLLCQKPAPGQVFNICSGSATQMSVLLNQMIELVDVKVKIEIDEARLKEKNEDVSIIYGSYNRLYLHCGWQPMVPLENSLKSMLL